ncbi:MAG: MBL fold metallo-hydrolase [Candidatus Methanomethylophilaceae archaeon]|jgi:phosphoribosyl 1,2-cyclic phosphodiesterase|nr:MBL fold metallo-hydrolase [Thermoplasmata archaeon]MBR3476728.1 MBL fold metallo-hydrolase [Candidatus Methanomethylophilaceae archaeon]MBR4216413.1 MBL fold metallo-hydrolase [Candidatus Methanomethylophilaceae archaeon]
MMEVHVLASGSDGNCTVIECDGEAIVVDAGLSCRTLMSYMDQEGVDPKMIKSILVTHEHSDHVSGVGPMARKLNVPVMCTMGTYKASRMGAVDFIPYGLKDSFSIGPMRVTPLPTYHDAAEPNAFFVESDQGKVAIVTDTGKFDFRIEHALKVCDAAVVEANYDLEMLHNGPYPPSLQRRIEGEHGHMWNKDTGMALKRNSSEKRKIFLAHLSRKNNLPDLARETVAEITGIKRMKIDCLEFQGDTRSFKVKG